MVECVGGVMSWMCGLGLEVIPESLYARGVCKVSAYLSRMIHIEAADKGLIFYTQGFSCELQPNNGSPMQHDRMWLCKSRLSFRLLQRWAGE